MLVVDEEGRGGDGGRGGDSRHVDTTPYDLFAFPYQSTNLLKCYVGMHLTRNKIGDIM